MLFSTLKCYLFFPNTHIDRHIVSEYFKVQIGIITSIVTVTGAESFTQPIHSTNKTNGSAVASFGTTLVGDAKTVEATANIVAKM